MIVQKKGYYVHKCTSSSKKEKCQIQAAKVLHHGRLGMCGLPEMTMTSETMISDRTDNEGVVASNVAGSMLLVNLFTPKAGMSDAFVEAQTAEYIRLKGKVRGWIGNRLGRTVDGSGQLVNVALFDSMDNYNAWRSSKLFADHVDIIRPFVEKSAPGMYELLYSAGEM
jgi:heme-degrading monooxygenase HmoA